MLLAKPNHHKLGNTHLKGHTTGRETGSVRIIWVFPKIGVPPKHFNRIGFSIINHPFWGTSIFGNTHIFLLGFFCINPWGYPACRVVFFLIKIMINLGIMKFHNRLLDIDVDKPEPLDLVLKDLLLRFFVKTCDGWFTNRE